MGVRRLRVRTICSFVTFLGAFTKLRKATISFVRSVRLTVRPYVRPHGTTGIPLDGFSWNLMFEDFWKLCRVCLRIFPCRRTAISAPHTRPTQRLSRRRHSTIRTVHTTYAAALKTTTHPKTRCRKPYAATQHLMLLMMGVCTWNMSS